MKLVYCTMCGDIFSPGIQTPKNCKCGYAFGIWKDPQKGYLEVASRVGEDGLRVIGLNNHWITQAAKVQNKERDENADIVHRAINERTSQEADGYLFKTRNCPVIMIHAGKGIDVFYNEELLKKS